MAVYAVIVAAGSGRRMGGAAPKQFVDLGNGMTALEWSVLAFQNCPEVDGIIVVLSGDWLSFCKDELRLDAKCGKIMALVSGGETRQESVYNGLAELRRAANAEDIVLIHDAARPFVTHDIISGVIKISGEKGSAVCAVLPKDTIKEVNGEVFSHTLKRDSLRAVQTPQGFRMDIICKAHEKARRENIKDATDDAVLVERMGLRVYSAPGDERNLKLTTPADLVYAKAMVNNNTSSGRIIDNMRSGSGFDVHRFSDDENRKLMLGGVEIPGHVGLEGHSDADVLVHALIDALFGAAALGDLGEHFPDSSAVYKDISSILLLRETMEGIRRAGFELVNADVTAVAQSPKLAPYREEMRGRLAEAMGTDISRLSVKATTTEGLGFTGRGEGIAAFATVLLEHGS